MTFASLVSGRRWPVISALGIVQIFAWGSSYYLLAVFAAPISADTGWPLSSIVAGLSLGLFVAGIASPRIGALIKVYGGKPVLLAASLLLASGLLILAAAPVLPIFILGWIVIGLGMGAGLYDAAFATLSGIYGSQARSAITSLTLWGGFASTACWPLSALLIENVGWRWSCATYALIQIGVCLPLIWFFVPRKAQSISPQSAPKSALRLSPIEQRAHLLMMAIMVLAGLSTSIVAVHLLTILQGRGLLLSEAVAIGALIGPAQVTARLIEMLSGGKHHPIWTMACAALLSAIGLITLAVGLPIAGSAVFVYAAGNGIFSIAKGALPLALFGADRYALIMGRLARPALISQAIAPSLGGIMLALIGHERTLAVIAAISAACVLLVVLLWQKLPSARA